MPDMVGPIPVPVGTDANDWAQHLRDIAAAANASYEAFRVVGGGGADEDIEADLAGALADAGSTGLRQRVVVWAEHGEFGSQLTIPSGVELAVVQGGSLKVASSIAGGALKFAAGTDRAGFKGTLDCAGLTPVGVLATGGATQLTVHATVANATSYGVDLQDAVDTADIIPCVSGCPFGVRVRGDCVDVDVHHGLITDVASYGVEFRATATDATVACKVRHMTFRGFDPSGSAKQAIFVLGAPGATGPSDTAFHERLLIAYCNAFGLAETFAAGSGGNGDLIAVHYTVDFDVISNAAVDGGENGYSITRYVRNGRVIGNLAARNFATGMQISRSGEPAEDIVVALNTCYDNALDTATGSNFFVQDAERVALVANKSFVDNAGLYVYGVPQLPVGYNLTNALDTAFEGNDEDGAVTGVQQSGTTTLRRYRTDHEQWIGDGTAAVSQRMNSLAGQRNEHDFRVAGVSRYRIGLNTANEWGVEARDAAGANARTVLRVDDDAANYGDISLWRGIASRFQLLAADLHVSHVGFATLASASSNTPTTSRRESSGAQNDEVVFELALPLRAGAYTFALFHGRLPSGGIVTIAGAPSDSANIATPGAYVDLFSVDTYDASTLNGQRTEVAGVVVPSSVRFVRLRMATKSASSSSYNGRVSALFGIRTGA